MGAEAISLLNGWAAIWTGGMARACGQGLLFIAAVWGLCRLLPRLPARTRCWLWWLTGLKLTVGLVCAAAIPLPLLLPVPPAAPQASAPPVPSPAAVSSAAAAETAPPLSPDEPDAAASRPLPRPAAAPGRPSPATGLFLVWLVGVLGLAAVGARQALLLRRLLRGAHPPGDAALTTETERLARLLRLRRPPRLAVSDAVAAPLVAGPRRPMIVLPHRFTETLSPEEVRLALAHEMVHIRRGDLWLGLLPALTQALFWFFPPAWLAARECAAACEEACDADVLRVTGAPAARYGQLPLKIVARGGRAPARPALGMASGFATLRRRLVTLRHLSDGSGTRAARRTALLLTPLALLLALPWRITAASRGGSAPSPAGSATDGSARYAVTDLGTLGGNYSTAYAINNRGEIVGSATLSPDEGRGHAFLWEPVERKMRDLGVLARTRSSVAMGINDAGWIVGNAYSGTRDGARIARAFLYTGGAMRGLGTLGGPYSHAYAVNNRGLVVGMSEERPGGTRHAVLWERGRITDLNRLLPADSGWVLEQARGINDSGQIVGQGIRNGQRRAFLLTPH